METKKPSTVIYSWILSNKIQQPIKLELELVKVVYDRMGRGHDSRYFKVYIGGRNVTQMVAEATNLKISKAKTTNGCVLVHGSGMDMGFALQDRVQRAAYQAGYPNMFDRDSYIYLGRKRGNKYVK